MNSTTLSNNPNIKKIVSLIETAERIKFTNVEDAFGLITQALNLSKVRDSQGRSYELGIAKSYLCLSWISQVKGKFEKGHQEAEFALKIFSQENNLPQQAKALANIGICQAQLGIFPKAFESMNEALLIATELNDKELKAYILSGLSIVYYFIGNQEAALSNGEASLQIYRHLNHPQLVTTLLLNCAIYLENLGQYKESLDYATEGLHFAEQFDGLFLQVNLLTAVGGAKRGLGKFEEALNSYHNSKLLSKKLAAENIKADLVYEIGLTYLHMGKISEAFEYLKKSIQLADKLEFKPLQIKCHQTISNAFKEISEFQNALIHLEKSIEIKQSIQNSSIQKNLTALEVLYKTKAIHLESELHRTKNEQLNAEIQRRKKVEHDLLEAKEEAEAASLSKSAFISKMSHEFRSPLTSILGYAQLLQKSHAHSAKVLKAATIIETSGNHLLNLINDILSYSKLEVAKQTLNNKLVHLEHFLAEIERLIGMQIEEKGLRFITEQDTHLPNRIIVDEHKLRQIIVNLLSNAVKFTNSGHIILKTVQLPSENPNHLRLRFEVIDSGVGIESAQIDKIFLPFEQTGDIKQRTNGTGLGLSIAQQLVNVLGGQIHVESELAKGSRFWFDLYLSAYSDTTQTEYLIKNKVATGYEGTPKKILVIDDMLPIRSYLRQFLETLGFLVYEANDGSAGIAKAKKILPDLILVDSLMPIMDGAETIQKLKGMPTLSSLPIIAMSAHLEEAGIKNIIHAGADDFLSKPFIPYEIIKKLESFLELTWRFSD